MSRICDRLKEQLNAALTEEERKEQERCERAKIDLIKEISPENIESELSAQIRMKAINKNYSIKYSIRLDQYKEEALRNDTSIRERLQQLADEGLCVYASPYDGLVISFDPIAAELGITGELDLSEIDAEPDEDDG
jgi:hypothetical protein